MVKNASQNGSAHIVIIIGLVLALIGSLGFIFWQNYIKVSEDADREALSSKSIEGADNDSEEIAPISDDEQVVSTFENYCKDLIVVPEGHEYMIIVGTMTQDRKRVVYSDEGDFAAINAGCSYKKAGSENMPGYAMTYVFKKADNKWSVIVREQQRPDEKVITMHGIPESFLELIGFGDPRMTQNLSQES